MIISHPYTTYSSPINKNNKNISKDKAKSKNLSNDVFQYLSANGNYNLAFTAAKKPIYAIDMNGNYQRFEGRKEAEQTLGIIGANISRCLRGDRDKAGEYTFMLASDIETIGEDGIINIDESKIEEKINKINSKDPFEKHKKAIYSVDKDGNFQRYSSLAEAAKEVETDRDNITACLTRKQKTSNGYGFIYAEEIEIKTPDGQTKINKRQLNRRIKEIKAAISSLPLIIPFYAIDKDGNCQRFERNVDACTALNISATEVKKCLEGDRNTANGYTFLYADEVETEDEDGNTIVQAYVPQHIFDYGKPVPIYSINEKGEIEKFASINQASTCLDIPRFGIFNCLSGERQSSYGHAFIKAEDLEIETRNGKKKINQAILQEKFEQVIKNAVYIVDKDGNYTRYRNGKEAADAIDTEAYNVIFCANGIKKTVNGYGAVKAFFVESLEDGTVVVNEKLLENIAKSVAKEQEREFYAIDKNNVRRKYRTKKEAAEKLGIDTYSIKKCLNGERKTAGGYRFIYKKDKNEIKKPKVVEDKPKKIYALHYHGNIYEFKDVDEAAEKLKVDKQDIINILKTGSTKGKKSSLNGYVFCTDDDE